MTATLISCALFVAGFVHYAELKSQLLETLTHQQWSLAERMAAEIDYKLRQRKEALRLLAVALSDTEVDRTELQQELAKAAPLLALFENVTVATVDGEIIGRLPFEQALIGRHYPRERDWITEPRKRRTGYVSRPFIGTVVTEPIVVVSVPVFNRAGAVQAILAGTLTVQGENFLGKIADEKVGRSGYFYIATVGSEPMIVVHPSRDRILQPIRPDNIALARALSGWEGTQLGTNNSGLYGLFSFKAVHEAPWLLGVVLPSSEALAPLTAAISTITFATSLMFVVLMPIVWLFTGWQLEPLRELHARIARLRSVHTFDEKPTGTEIKQVEAAFTGLMAERDRAERALVQQREHAVVTLKSIADAVIVVRVSGIVDFMNTAAERLVGLALPARGTLMLEQVFKLVDAVTEIGLEEPLGKVLASDNAVSDTGAALLTQPHGRKVPIEYTAAPIRDATARIEAVVIAFRDVSHQRQLAAELSWQASHDALTKLPNRTELERRLEAALRTPRADTKGPAFLFVDLDEFKVVNDTGGHAAGDELLRQLSSVLLEHARKSDTVARIGGDEFGVILQDCPSETALKIAESMRSAVQEFRFAWQGRTYAVGASIGIVCANGDSMSMPEVLAAADGACYFAKEMGRNRVHLHHAEDEELAIRRGQMEWVSRIHDALDTGRFALHAQSIMPLGGAPAEPLHFEVLLRIKAEDGKFVPPSTFIPAAERYHLMPLIDRWVVHTALTLLKHETRASRIALASINLSGPSISDENFLAFLIEELEASALPVDTLCFEITETAAVSNVARAARFMGALRERGCKFALDDFGSGMSSFTYLKNLPLDFLKIDGTFVRDIQHDRISRSIVQAINNIAHDMGMRTIAEYAEDEATLALLRECGVDYAQGFGIDRPRPIADVLTAGSPRKLALVHSA